MVKIVNAIIVDHILGVPLVVHILAVLHFVHIVATILVVHIVAVILVVHIVVVKLHSAASGGWEQIAPLSKTATLKFINFSRQQL